MKTKSGSWTVRLDDFEKELKLIKKVYPDTQIIFIGIINDHHVLWSKLQGPKPWFQYYFYEFEQTYSLILKKYAKLIRSFGLEPVFSFADEPGTNPEKRRIVYLCSSIAKKAGLKTWSGTYLNSNKQLPLSVGEKARNVNYLRPLDEVLDVWICPQREFSEEIFKEFKQKNIMTAYSTTGAATSVRPVYNRFFQGISALVTDVKFVTTYAYRDAFAKPYDDLDVPSNWVNKIGMNDFLLTYPSWQGAILPTLSYEALREGVEDSQLITTLQVLSDKAMRRKEKKLVKIGEESKRFLNNVFRRVNKNFLNAYWSKQKPLPVDPMEMAILRDLNDGKSEKYEIFDQIRWDVCSRIIILQKALADET